MLHQSGHPCDSGVTSKGIPFGITGSGPKTPCRISRRWGIHIGDFLLGLPRSPSAKGQSCFPLCCPINCQTRGTLKKTSPYPYVLRCPVEPFCGPFETPRPKKLLILATKVVGSGTQRAVKTTFPKDNSGSAPLELFLRKAANSQSFDQTSCQLPKGLELKG